LANNFNLPIAAKRRRQDHLLSEINVTPMVDVMLVLVIIFIVTGQMVVSGTEVDLPDSRASQLTSQDEPLQISVDAQQNIYLGEELVDPAGFADAMAQLALASGAPGEQRVFVRADRSLAYGNVMAIVGQIADAGFTKVAFISDPAADADGMAMP
jgi:biopolymer transport protein TolR